MTAIEEMSVWSVLLWFVVGAQLLYVLVALLLYFF
jgi:hypothetical protein